MLARSRAVKCARLGLVLAGRYHAAMRADELMEAGDMEGEAVWLRIVKAIEELLSKERPEDAEVH